MPYLQVNFDLDASARLQDPYERWRDTLRDGEVREEELVMASANPFYNAFVAAYFQQRKQLNIAPLVLMAVCGFLVWSDQDSLFSLD